MVAARTVQKQDEKPDESDDVESGEVSDSHVATSWEFVGQPPTVEVVMAKLRTLPEIWGIEQGQYVDYVQPLAQSKNISRDKTRKEYTEVWTLYFTVAGRIAMVNQAAMLNDWTVDFEPEPVTPTGMPGYLEYGDRIVYREYCVIRDTEGRLVGRRPGTAWVPGQGGAGAVASNRFEKVETSARGRSIGAWGFGVIPGSGVASLDEMQAVAELRRSEQRGGQRNGQQQQTGRQRKPREDVESDLRVVLAEYKQLTGLSDEAMDEKIDEYAKHTFNRPIPKTENGAYDLSILKEGEVVIMLQAMQGGLNRVRAEQSGLTG